MSSKNRTVQPNDTDLIRWETIRIGCRLLIHHLISIQWDVSRFISHL